MSSQNIYDGVFWIAVASCAVAQIFILRAVFRVTPSTIGRGPSVAGAAPSVAELGSTPTSAMAATALSAIATGANTASPVYSAAGDVTSSPEGETVSVPTPHRLTEIVWVVLPVVLLVLAFVGAWRVMHPALPDWLPPGAEIIRR